ncbi:MAG: hypothetical protein HQM10_07810 [Candidatus Riflebacteria bacterium]|nr:hypothetical protein [Candidatus Riflebacteria bacterium]
MDNTYELFSPCYKGKRFESHRFPVELAEDLLILKKMTIEMAKDIYLKENPNRKRIPKNFTNGISIELENIESGSTVLRLVLITILTTLVPDGNQQCFMRAPEKIIKVIEAAHLDKELKGLVPAAVLDCFSLFGNNLQDDEQIIFGDKEISQAIYNKESRKRLLLAASKSRQYTDQCELRGKIIALDKDRKTFEIQLFNGQKIKGKYNISDLETLQEAFVNLEKNQKIWLKAVAVFNADDKLQNIETIEESSLLELLDVQARLEELAALPDGWLDGEQGGSLDSKALKWLGTTFENSFNSEKLPLPAAFPTPDGNVQFEWSLNENEITLEVDLITKKAAFYAINTNNHEEETAELDLNSSDGWNNLNHRIQAFHG